MELIQMIFNYCGAVVETIIQPEETIRGTVYPIDMDGNYCFTVYKSDDDDWCIFREPDATVPMVESELYNKIIKQLQYELKYAA